MAMIFVLNSPGMQTISPAVSKNLLPGQGDARYQAALFAPAETNRYLRDLTATLAWKHEAIKIFGQGSCNHA